MRRKVIIKTKPKVLWYENLNKMWEKEYLQQELLPDYEHVSLDKYTSLDKDLKNIKVFVINDDGLQNIKKYNDYIDIIKKYNPQLLIHLSDEYFICNEIVKNIYPLFETVWRQYPFKLYDLPHIKNVKVIPLGYNIGFSNIINKDNENRKYFWSFVGNYKNKNNSKERDDRIDMIEQFKKNNKNYFISDNIKSEEIKEIYSQSIFVPIGLNLLSGKIKTDKKYEIYVDCFRTYEALVCGAIPVTINNKNTFDYNTEPPIIYADTYEQLFNKINNMSKEEIIMQRKKLFEWWNNIISDLKNSIMYLN